MPRLCWLHLSDWHQRGEDFDRSVVRDALLDDIRTRDAIDARLSEVDFIVFSGDAAFRGVTSEFDAARQNLFAPVLKETGLKSADLFFVPGNHDLNRDVIPEMLPLELQNPLASDDQAKKWLTDERRRKRALEPFEDYDPRYVNAYNFVHLDLATGKSGNRPRWHSAN
jgi:predicted MPP superfamily phosphohydrolase